MQSSDFEYEVAFSFAAKDEAIAQSLNDLISDRLKTFIYSQRQKELAGRDGQEAFSEVYAKQARIVVILYSDVWGKTPWTRVEMDAIKNRSLDDGWDFTIFIPTDKTPLPSWVPKTRLYVGLERWGVVGAAPVIEARVSEFGGEVHQETAQERATRFKKAADLQQKKIQFGRSETGVSLAQSAYQVVKDTIATRVSEQSLSQLGLTFVDRSGFGALGGVDGANMVLSYHIRFANSLEGAALEAKFYKGFPQIPGFNSSFEKAILWSERKFQYVLVREGHSAFVDVAGSSREFDGERLADELVISYLDVAEKLRL